MQRELLEVRRQTVEHGGGEVVEDLARRADERGEPATLGGLGDQAERSRPSLGPLGQVARLILVDRSPKLSVSNARASSGRKARASRSEHEGVALDEQTRQAPQGRARPRRDDEVQARGGTGEQAVHQRVSRRAVVEHVEVVEDQDGVRRQLLDRAQDRRRQDLLAGTRGHDVEGGLADTGSDLPQRQHDASGEEVGIGVGLIEREPRDGSIEVSERPDTSRQVLP